MLQLVEPHLSGPRGEVPILLWSEKHQRKESICGEGTAPAAADTACFRGLGMEQVPGIGLLAATVPGAFGAWMRMLRDDGSWNVAQVLAPAIDFSRHGFPLVPRIVQAIAAVKPLFEPSGPPRLRAGDGRQAQIDAAVQCWYEGFVPARSMRFRVAPGARHQRGASCRTVAL